MASDGRTPSFRQRLDHPDLEHTPRRAAGEDVGDFRGIAEAADSMALAVSGCWLLGCWVAWCPRHFLQQMQISNRSTIARKAYPHRYERVGAAFSLLLLACGPSRRGGLSSARSRSACAAGRRRGRRRQWHLRTVETEAARKAQLYQSINVWIEGAPYVSGALQENGSFLLLDVPPGNVTISFAAPGAPDAKLVLQNIPGNADVYVPALILAKNSVKFADPAAVQVRMARRSTTASHRPLRRRGRPGRSPSSRRRWRSSRRGMSFDAAGRGAGAPRDSEVGGKPGTTVRPVGSPYSLRFVTTQRRSELSRPNHAVGDAVALERWTL